MVGPAELVDVLVVVVVVGLVVVVDDLEVVVTVFPVIYDP